jgi:hypothetical protein
VRAYWDGKRFVSRLGNQFFAPAWFTAGYPSGVTFDGELFTKRADFNTAVSIVKSKDAADRWKTVTYRCFDLPHLKDMKWEQRMQQIKQYETKINNPYFKVCLPLSPHSFLAVKLANYFVCGLDAVCGTNSLQIQRAFAGRIGCSAGSRRRRFDASQTSFTVYVC